MVKQALVYLILSILIVVFASWAHLLLVYITTIYTWIVVQITPIFSISFNGILIRNIIALVLIPVIIVGIPALIFRLVKGKAMPYFMEITWVLWLIIVLGKVLIK